MDYDDFRALASDLTADFGNRRTCTITQIAAGTYDPLTGITTGGGPTDTDAICVLVPMSEREMTLSPGTLVRDRTIKAVIAASNLPEGFAPAIGNQVTIPDDAIPYVIDDIGLARPDGEPISWTLYLGRADA